MSTQQYGHPLTQSPSHYCQQKLSMYPPNQTEHSVGIAALGQDKVLYIVIKSDGHNLTPTYATLVDAMYSQFPQAPISIEMYNWDNTSGGSQSSGSNPRILAKFATYLDLFYTAINRWKSVRLDAPLISLVVPLTEQKYPSGKPTSLESVAIKDTDSVRDMNMFMRFMSILWSGNAWSFSQFSIDTYRAFNKQIFPDLPYSRLTHLDVESTVTAALVHEILSEAFGITKCRISDVTSPGPSRNCLDAHTPNLEYLQLDIDTMDFDKAKSTGAIVSILNKLVAPALTDLRIGYEDRWSGTVFTGLCQRSQFKLETLHLNNVSMSPRHVEQILILNPTLRELVIASQTSIQDDEPQILLTEDILQKFIGGKTIVPDLECLAINITAVETESGWFRRMVRDRFRHGSLRQVKINDAQCLEERDLNALVELASYKLSLWLDGERYVDPRWHW
ncbi:hypothetical protein BDN70DRAFT_192196 [Pholiota conissans]|uniref:Uncharacterized protein n=1 Tax=Pholiota conissans TaxID=109636 RepID=A0A9P5YVS8_9AGAR|nr:hypothetical protein BDN70DRAFT_192196 [Pholiota conissans]